MKKILIILIALSINTINAQNEIKTSIQLVTNFKGKEIKQEVRSLSYDVGFHIDKNNGSDSSSHQITLQLIGPVTPLFLKLFEKKNQLFSGYLDIIDLSDKTKNRKINFDKAKYNMNEFIGGDEFGDAANTMIIINCKKLIIDKVKIE